MSLKIIFCVEKNDVRAQKFHIIRLSLVSVYDYMSFPVICVYDPGGVNNLTSEIQRETHRPQFFREKKMY